MGTATARSYDEKDPTEDRRDRGARPRALRGEDQGANGVDTIMDTIHAIIDWAKYQGFFAGIVLPTIGVVLVACVLLGLRDGPSIHVVETNMPGMFCIQGSEGLVTCVPR